MVFGLTIKPDLYGQQTAPPADSINSNAAARSTDQLAALQLELTNAWQQVLHIVNQPVKAYVRAPNTSATVFSPGWFHPGASKPDFNTVDIRQSQELPYAGHKFVTSDLNPGLVFLGQDLEFNSMTKYFYTNRSLPKRKLTEAEMLEINRLYRVIGRCERDIDRLQAPPVTDASQPGNADGQTESIIPGQSFESIRKLPMQTRILYASVAMAVLLALVIVLRIVRKKAG